ncbi:MAG: 4a-hydroxytetrahydrobiopterin dehydratase [Anaerolineae bacterium]|nr:4a-hydroxytetrahydrobiopterin dehydratase [Gemmatimonadaceae bacterium]
MPKDTAYSNNQIAEKLKDLSGWRVEEGALVRNFETDGWPTTLMLVNMIGFFAEAADHHPDLAVSWSKVAVKLSTHSAGGITEKDFALARLVDQWSLWRPESGGALAGTPRPFVKSGSAKG